MNLPCPWTNRSWPFFSFPAHGLSTFTKESSQLTVIFWLSWGCFAWMKVSGIWCSQDTRVTINIEWHWCCCQGTVLYKSYWDLHYYFFSISCQWHCSCLVTSQMALTSLLPLPISALLKDKYGGDMAPGPEEVEKLKDEEQMVSETNEESVWSFLHTRASLLLKAYPSSIEVCTISF